MSYLPAPNTVQLFDPGEPGMAAFMWIAAKNFGSESPWVQGLLVELVRSLQGSDSVSFTARVALAIDELAPLDGYAVAEFMKDLVTIK